MSTTSSQSSADRQSAALAELEARSAAVQHEIDEVTQRVHPPHEATFADPEVDDAAFPLDGALPKQDEIRRAERLHEDDAERLHEDDAVAETPRG